MMPLDYAPGLPAKGELGKPTEQLSPGQLVKYVLQHHRTRRRPTTPHYDLRLGTPETGLFSWAVPKAELPGPGERRLAPQTEVHRYSYGDFSGHIPSGYGAGDVQQAANGKALITKVTPNSVQFTVADSRIPQRYMLVKIQTPKGRDWLLIGQPVGRAEVPGVGDKPSIRKLDAADLDEALAQATEVQAKIDGAHGVFDIDPKGRFEAYSVRPRVTGEPIVHTERLGVAGHKAPELANTTFRGEIFGTRDDKAIPFSEVSGLLNANIARSLEEQRQRGVTMKYAPFKLLRYKGQPAPEDLGEQRRILEEVVKQLPGHPTLPERATGADMRRLIERIRAGKLPSTGEGAIVHTPAGPRKLLFTSEGTGRLAGTYPGAGRRAATAGGLLVNYPGAPQPVRVGTGFTDAELQRIVSEIQNLEGQPVRVGYKEQLPSGMLRAPSFLGFETDKPEKAAADLRKARSDDECPKCKQVLKKCCRFAVTDGERFYHPWCLPKAKRLEKQGQETQYRQLPLANVLIPDAVRQFVARRILPQSYGEDWKEAFKRVWQDQLGTHGMPQSNAMDLWYELLHRGLEIPLPAGVKPQYTTTSYRPEWLPAHIRQRANWLTINDPAAAGKAIGGGEDPAARMRHSGMFDMRNIPYDPGATQVFRTDASAYGKATGMLRRHPTEPKWTGELYDYWDVAPNRKELDKSPQRLRRLVDKLLFRDPANIIHRFEIPEGEGGMPDPQGLKFLTLPAATAQPPSRWSRLSPYTRYGLIGGGVAGAAGLALALRRWLQKRREEQEKQGQAALPPAPTPNPPTQYRQLPWYNVAIPDFVRRSLANRLSPIGYQEPGELWKNYREAWRSSIPAFRQQSRFSQGRSELLARGMGVHTPGANDIYRQTTYRPQWLPEATRASANWLSSTPEMAQQAVGRAGINSITPLVTEFPQEAGKVHRYMTHTPAYSHTPAAIWRDPERGGWTGDIYDLWDVGLNPGEEQQMDITKRMRQFADKALFRDPANVVHQYHIPETATGEPDIAAARWLELAQPEQPVQPPSRWSRMSPTARGVAIGAGVLGTAGVALALRRWLQKRKEDEQEKQAQRMTADQQRTLAQVINQAEFGGSPPRTTNTAGRVFMKTPIKHYGRTTTHGYTHQQRPGSSFAYAAPEDWNRMILAQLASNIHRHGSTTLRDAIKRFVGPDSTANHFRFMNERLPGWLDRPGTNALPSYVEMRKGGQTDEQLNKELTREGRKVNTNPTDAQAEAGNYRMGHVRIHGLDITIENPRGSTRSGTSGDGTTWSNHMYHHYGYIRLTESDADGDHIDVFIGPNPASTVVFVIDQSDGQGTFDEHKCMLGFQTEEEARRGYLSCYDAGWKCGPITMLSLGEFKAWLADGKSNRPVADQFEKWAVGHPCAVLWVKRAAEGWHGVDLDGTLAEYDGWKGDEYIGRPIKKMVDRIKRWLRDGQQVKIMTTRGGNGEQAKKVVSDWTLAVFGQRLEVTNEKDPMMVDLWDDRVVRVRKNTGEKAASMIKEVPLEVIGPVRRETKARLTAELADNPVARARGLAKRSHLPDDRGMLFDTPGPFWMRGCKIALDLMWLDKQGTVLEYVTMPVAQGRLPTYRTDKAAAALALEVPAGWCAKHGIIAGDRVVLGA